MTSETPTERRSFITAASSAALSLALLPKRATAQPADTIASAASSHFEGTEINVGTTQFSSGDMETALRCSWCMGFLEPA